MCLRRRFKKNINDSVAAGTRELVLDLEERCCIRQLSLYVNMNDSTGTNQSRWIIKIDEDEILNESCQGLYASYSGWAAAATADRPFQTVKFDDTAKIYGFVFLDFGRVERRFAVFFENKDTSNIAFVRVGVIYDILEDEK